MPRRSATSEPQLSEEKKGAGDEEMATAPSLMFAHLPRSIQTRGDVFMLRKPIWIEDQGDITHAKQVASKGWQHLKKLHKDHARFSARSNAKLHGSARVYMHFSIWDATRGAKVVSIDLGIFSNNALTKVRFVPKAVISTIHDTLLQLAAEYGMEMNDGIRIDGIGARLHHLLYEERGRCSSKKMTTKKLATYTLKSPAAKLGACGLSAVAWGVKHSPDIWSNLDQRVKVNVFPSVRTLLSSALSSTLKRDEWLAYSLDNAKGTTPAMLATLLEPYKIELIVHTETTLIHGGLPTYVSPPAQYDSQLKLVLSDGHFWCIAPLPKCKVCGQDRGPRHACSHLCKKCGVWFIGSAIQHEKDNCLQEAPPPDKEEEKNIEPQLREDDTARAMMISAEVEAILDGDFDSLEKRQEESLCDAINVIRIGDSFKDPIPAEECELLGIPLDRQFHWQDATREQLFFYNYLVLGEAGTGKTTAVLKALTVPLVRGALRPERLVITSFQGIATSQYVSLKHQFGIDIRTIHSLIGKGQHYVSQAALTSRLKAMEKVRLLVIDEIGSVSPALFRELDQFMRKAKSMPDKPFGGVQMLLVGDFGQSLPVASSGCIFDEPIWDSLELHVAYLYKQKRVADLENPDNRAFVKMKMEFYRGVVTKEALQLINRNRFNGETMRYEDFHHVVSTNNEVSIINEIVAATKTVVDLFPSKWTKAKKNKIPQTTYELAPDAKRCIDIPLRFWEGCRLMFTDNSFLRTTGNGNGSFCKGISLNGAKLTVEDASGKQIVISPRKIDKVGCTHYPLKLAYASSNHKIQGLSLDRVCIWPSINSARASAAGLMAMAISRVRAFDQLFIGSDRPLEARHIVYSPRLTTYMRLCSNVCHGDRGARAKLNLEILRDAPVRCDYSPAMKCKRKSISLEELVFRTRAEARTLGVIKKMLQLFHKIIPYDYETSSQSESGSAIWRARARPYGVAAKCWEEYVPDVFTAGVGPHGVEDGMDRKFYDWVMSKVYADIERWEKGKSKSDDPHIMIAYNGSGFDHMIFVESCIKIGMPPGFTWHFPATKGGKQLVRAELKFVNEKGLTKTCLRTWDPCLWLASPLSSAFDNFASPSERARLSGKGVFPHDYISRVGVREALKPGLQEIPISDFPVAHRSVLAKRISSGELTSPRKGVVLFDCNREYHAYVLSDVECLEAVIEGMQELVSNDLLPEHNLRIFDLNTASSFSEYAWHWTCPKEFMEMSDPRVNTLSKIYHLSIESSNRIRKSIYGGCCNVRRRKPPHVELGDHPIWSDLDEDKTLAYIDNNGLYHAALMNYDYPCGSPLILNQVENQAIITAFMDDFSSGKDMPLFIALLDMHPCTGDVEPFLPHREAEKGSLLWDNTPKIQQYYTSVDIARCLKNHGHFENVSEVFVWGTYKFETKAWTANKGKVFENVGRVSLQLRKQAADEGKPGLKVFAKLKINSLYGKMSLRETHNTFKMFHITSADSDLQAMLDAAATTMNATIVDWYVLPIGPEENKVERMDDGSLIDHRDLYVFAKFELPIKPGGHSAKAPHIGAFVLAYSRDIMDTAVDHMLGPKRYEEASLTGPGIYYSDTDSFMVSYSLIRHIPNIHWDAIGSFSDDLCKSWRKGALKKKMDARCPDGQVERMIDGTPYFAKLVNPLFAGKKMYCGRAVAPFTNAVFDMKIKAKGVPRKGGAIVTGRQFDLWMEEAMDQARDEILMTYAEVCETKVEDIPESFRIPEKEVEELARHKLKERFMEIRKDQSLVESHIRDSVATGGIVVGRMTLEKGCLLPSKEARIRGDAPLQLTHTIMTRRILSAGPTFSEDRVPLEHNPDFSMPRGWKAVSIPQPVPPTPPQPTPARVASTRAARPKRKRGASTRAARPKRKRATTSSHAATDNITRASPPEIDGESRDEWTAMCMDAIGGPDDVLAEEPHDAWAAMCMDSIAEPDEAF